MTAGPTAESDPELELSRLRSAIHDYSQRAFSLRLTNWSREARDKFYGALDALLDTGGAAQSYSSIVKAHKGPNLLAAYGFLQALFVQQDAVATIGDAFPNLPHWSPNSIPELRNIRDIRNRLTGHPARTDRSGPPSSAIIPHIDRNGFVGHIYFENKSEQVRVDVVAFARQNATHLLPRLSDVERAMKAQENAFKEKVARPFGDVLGNTFSYHITKLVIDWSDPDEVRIAGTYLTMIEKSVRDFVAAAAAAGLGEQALKHHSFMALEAIRFLGEQKATLSRSRSECDLLHTALNEHADRLMGLAAGWDEQLMRRD